MKAIFIFCIFFISITINASEVNLQKNKNGIWSIKPTNTHSRWVIIHNLSQAESSGIYHIEVIARKFKYPKWQIEHVQKHMAITESALKNSVIAPLKTGDVYPESYNDGYQAWLKQGENAAICATTIIECLAK
jgi:hypothetical protein